MENKPTLIFRIYQILNEYSDIDHPLTQKEIIELLNRDYGMSCERQAVSRNFSYLRECGVDIYSDRKGSYLETREFEPSELRLLIDSVLGSRHINPKHSKDLINKLVGMGGKNFEARINNIHTVGDWNKTENLDLLYNIDVIDEAIECGVKIKFTYNKYGIDKKLHVSETHIVSPYQMLVHNQHYYLFSRNERWENIGYYRIDKIKDIEILKDRAYPLKNISGFEHGIDYKKISSCHPYMFADEPKLCVIKADPWVIDAVIDWFGFDVKVEDNKDGTVNISLVTSLNAMEYWAMQYGKFVEVIAPTELRERVKKSLEIANEKYNK